jgi:glucose/arabinose dehydrogenase
MRRMSHAVIAALMIASPSSAAAQTLQAGFQQGAAFTGLTQPTAVKFASDGRVFVAEKSGLIKVFDNLSDTTPTVFADLRTNVHNYWDRGLLGLELHPNFPSEPYVYVLYALDAPIGGTAPRWGVAGMTTDPCPSPPGATADGCVVGARLSRLTASGNVATGPETVFLEDWCQQYPSHSIGTIAFGSDGALYVTGGDGASFNWVDYGQDGAPVNPCGDPPSGLGGTQTPPSAEGGALRSQDLERVADPTGYAGTVLRLDPITGQALPDNPLYGGVSADDDRIIAYGLRNPFRMTVRPGTNEVWVGDVGWSTWEEINRVVSPTDGTIENFGWPCYEGAGRQSGYDSANLSICESLYAGSSFGAVTAPFYTYNHSSKVVTNETCPTGSSAIAGLAFYGSGAYPTQYQGALFFADYNRDCIWAILADGTGVPNPNSRQTFVAAASNPVQLTIGPGGDLFYVDLDGGRIMRIQYKGPDAVVTATPTSGSAPLFVTFSGTGSTDPDGQTLQFAWDLDNDGAFDDGSQSTATYTYVAAGTVTARLRVTDTDGLTDTATVAINVGNGSPTASIAAPLSTRTWQVGEQILFSGSGTDPEQGTLPASAMTWALIMQHCPSDCHPHTIQQYDGVASGQFVAPDHEYPSHLELRLTVRDSAGATNTAIVDLQPKVVDLTFESAPAGLQLVLGATSKVAPFTERVIVGSSNSVSASSPQLLGGQDYAFSSWSDGGAQAHNIVAPAAPATYQAVFEPLSVPVLSVSGASVVEGTGGTASLVFTVTLSPSTGNTVTVNYATGGGTATPGSDYGQFSAVLTFAPGTTTQTIVVSVSGDAIDEADETITLTLSDATNAVIGTAVAQGTIVDDDALPSVTINDVTMVEGNTGTVTALFVVSLSAASGSSVEVDYATVGGSATSGQDFLPVQGTLIIAPGSTTGTIPVAVIGDTLREPTESYSVRLNAVRNATLVDASGVGKITDNDKGKR